MPNHTYRRHRPAPPPPGCRLVHYDPRTLSRTEAPLRAVAHQCAYCGDLIAPDAARRNDLGDWACKDRQACWERVTRNEGGAA